MGRRVDLKDRQPHYCPKCGYKKLYADAEYDREVNRSVRVWICRHNQLSRLEKRNLQYNWDPDAKAATERKFAENPPCGTEIRVRGRDAEISDYGNVLDKIVMADKEFENWLLANDQSLRRKGMDIIHKDELMTVVRVTADYGVCIRAYWEPAREDREWEERRWLTSRAARRINHGPLSLHALFSLNHYVLWRKDGTQIDPDRPLLFSGNLNKKLKQEITEWAGQLTKALPSIVDYAKSETERWEAEERILWGEVLAYTPLIEVSYYDGNDRTCHVNIHGRITREQAKVIARVLAEESKPEVTS